MPNFWDVYSERLAHYGLGYALWDPEPPISTGEVHVGDVAVLHEGQCVSYFNAIRLREDQHSAMIPYEYVPMLITSVDWRYRNNLVGPDILSSASMTSMSASIGATAYTSLFAGTGGSLSFRCSESSGAILALNDKTKAKGLFEGDYIVDFLKTRFPAWLHHINSTVRRSYTLEDLIFVCDTIKTTQWLTAVHTDDKQRTVDFNLSVQAPSIAGANASFSYANESSGLLMSRTGPKNRPVVLSSNLPANGNEDTIFDQCIFIHFYKCKQRFTGLRVMRAAAGPADLPSGDPKNRDDPRQPSDSYANSDSGPYELDFEMCPKRTVDYDPVGYVLDYILDHAPEATMAIASTMDLCAILKDEAPNVWNDIPKALATLRPPIKMIHPATAVIRRDALRKDDVGDRPCGNGKPVLGRTQERTAPAGDMDVPPADDSIVTHALHNENANQAQGADVLHEEADGFSEFATEEGHSGPVTRIAYSPDGKFVATAGNDTRAFLWKAKDGHIHRRLPVRSDIVWDMAFTPNGQRLFIGSDDSLTLWNVMDGDVVTTLARRTNAVQSVACSPRGTVFASGSMDGTICLWDAVTYKKLLQHQESNTTIDHLAFSPDGEWLASGGSDGFARLWDVKTLALKMKLEGHVGTLTALTFSADSLRIVTASDDGSCKIWLVQSGKMVLNIDESCGPLLTISLSPKGDRVAFVPGAMDEARVYDTRTGNSLLVLHGHTLAVSAIAFSPDARTIATGGHDNRVVVWSNVDGSCLATFEGHSGPITSVVFSPDGKSLVAGGLDGSVQFHRVQVAT